jgi:hypothetical protein
MRAFLTVSILLLAATVGFAEDPMVVLATTRAGRIEAFDEALNRLGTIGINQLVESVSASPDGHKLYIAQEYRGECCSLYALDMQTLRMCSFAGSTMFAVPSADGHSIFTQGSRGVDEYDADSLRLRMLRKAPGTYNLQPSPDGKWLLGITNSEGPSLDVFDLSHSGVDRRIEIPTGPATGAWAGDRFYLFSYSAPGKGSLWSVKPEDTKLSQPKEIELPDLHAACNQPVLLMLAGAADKLFLAEAFGYKIDRRKACPDVTAGGIYVIEPSTGHVNRIAASVRVNRMVVTPDGHDIYAIHSASPARQSEVHLMHIDANSGRTLAFTTLESGDWNLTLTHTPATLLPRGYVRAAIACSH